MSIGYHPEFAAIVGANPGFFVLNPIFDEFGMTIGADRLPVLAWGIDAHDYCAYPIINGKAYYRQSPFLMEPNGTIERLMTDRYRNYEIWLERQQANFHNKKAKRR